LHKLLPSTASRRALLPNEARLVDQSRQAVLTERYLLPALPELEAFFLAVRFQVDAQLEFTLPSRMGKPYPLGQCLEISQAAHQQLQRQDLHTLALSASAQLGHTAFFAFRRAGSADGRVMLGDATAYMISLTQVGRFEPSEAVLRDPAMPLDLFRRARAGPAGICDSLPDNPDQGRGMALRACLEYRRKRWHISGRKIVDVISSVSAINGKLLPATAPRPATVHSEHISFAMKVQKMSTSEIIQINGIEYKVANLSEAARRELAMLQATDARLAELQRDVAINQTARNAYANALVALLPSA